MWVNYAFEKQRQNVGTLGGGAMFGEQELIAIYSQRGEDAVPVSHDGARRANVRLHFHASGSLGPWNEGFPPMGERANAESGALLGRP